MKISAISFSVFLLVGGVGALPARADDGAPWSTDEAKADFQKAQADSPAHRVTYEFLLGDSPQRIKSSKLATELSRRWDVIAENGECDPTPTRYGQEAAPLKYAWKRFVPRPGGRGDGAREWTFQVFKTRDSIGQKDVFRMSVSMFGLPPSPIQDDKGEKIPFLIKPNGTLVIRREEVYGGEGMNSISKYLVVQEARCRRTEGRHMICRVDMSKQQCLFVPGISPRDKNCLTGWTAVSNRRLYLGLEGNYPLEAN